MRYRATLHDPARLVASFEFDAGSMQEAMAYVTARVPGWTAAARVEIEVVS